MCKRKLEAEKSGWKWKCFDKMSWKRTGKQFILSEAGSDKF